MTPHVRRANRRLKFAIGFILVMIPVNFAVQHFCMPPKYPLVHGPKRHLRGTMQTVVTQLPR